MTRAELSRYVRVALALLAREDPRLSLRGRLRQLPGGRGGRSHLLAGEVACGPVVIKIRADLLGGIERERRALLRAPRGRAPALRAVFDVAGSSARATTARERAALDVPVGPALVMERLPGRSLSTPISEAVLGRAAGTLIALHRTSPRGLRPTLVPSAPPALLRMAEAQIDALAERRLVDRPTVRGLRQAVRLLERHVQRTRRWGGGRPPRRFCHGDLRWENLVADGDDARLVDFEHAGAGDPALDLAMLVCRTPVGRFDELRLLDAYVARLGRGVAPAFIDRYFALRPVVGLAAATGAALDLAAVAAGATGLRTDVQAHVRERLPALERELEVALVRAGTPPAGSVRLARRSLGLGAKVRARIAVDGTAASAKSPLARALARALGVPYVNTGAAYRYAAWWAVERGLDPSSERDRSRLVRHLRRASLALTGDGAVQVGRARFDHRLTAVAVEDAVAAWAAHREVRAALAAPIGRALRRRGVVVEGRDAGTVLVPDAEHKLYVDAPLGLRAAWLAERAGIPRRRARASIAARDERDRARAEAPLRRARGAILVRSDAAPLDEIVARLARRVRGA